MKWIGSKVNKLTGEYALLQPNQADWKSHHHLKNKQLSDTFDTYQVHARTARPFF
jgi:hypothetical protein